MKGIIIFLTLFLVISITGLIWATNLDEEMRDKGIAFCEDKGMGFQRLHRTQGFWTNELESVTCIPIVDGEYMNARRFVYRQVGP